MWTAPELLRDMTSSFAVRQSQTGDLYSFGIILHEIVTREAPWDDTGYTKMGISPTDKWLLPVTPHRLNRDDTIRLNLIFAEKRPPFNENTIKAESVVPD
ncbi:hypothetical protein DPMN_104393 [Dreissena polymorpha]|uniref:Protein kinase domain-containing protein n=1 Tax=Dreissena polymorpha TaxID=45954 RepID=A0A9D4HD05_DREPO|nr:hypothetical protein DPMN_104393 [Dreissena polymorpha]